MDACVQGASRLKLPRRWVSIAGLALVGLMVACSPLRIAEGLLGDSAVRTADIAYGTDARQRLDVYRPRSARGRSPVVVFLYGGRWQNGSKDQYRLLGAAFTRNGVIAVVPDYRLYPQVKFPGWVDDAAEAVRWTQKNIQRFGGDTSKIFIVGHSAGAHTAVLLALDEHYLRDAGLPAASVKGYVSIAGPIDTVWTDADVQTLMGPRDGWPATYPRTHIDGTKPRILLLHGAADKTVSPANSAGLAAQLAARGDWVKSIVYRGVGHIDIIVALSVPQLGIAPVMRDLIQFIHGRS